LGESATFVRTTNYAVGDAMRMTPFRLTTEEGNTHQRSVGSPRKRRLETWVVERRTSGVKSACSSSSDAAKRRRGASAVRRLERGGETRRAGRFGGGA
jgi:hypothetical protein